MGTSLAYTGDLAESRAHCDRAVALFDPAEHRPLAALTDAEQALKNARQIGQAATLTFALLHATVVHRWCGHYEIANANTDATIFVPDALLRLAIAYAELGQFVDAWSSINEAIQMIETTGQKLFEAEVHRIAGEIALMSPARDAANAQAHFERALGIARQQQAKSWELRAAMSMARLWRDQGKAQQARELLGPVYGWFTEGFDTVDLKHAKALLDALAS
jgi:tetratricopeptide (TPR) repeat protein